MKSSIGVLLILACASGAFAAAPDTIVYHTGLSPANEVPPIPNLPAQGTATITVTLTRDAAGLVTAGTVDFDIRFSGFAAGTVFTGLHIHNAPEGVNGSVVINTGIGGANAVTTASGSGTIFRRVVIDGSNAATLRFLRGVAGTPRLYYVNLHTRVFPGGAIRGQLAPVSAVFRTLMGSDQEVPPIAGLNALGVGTTTITVNRGATGSIISGVVDFDILYQFPTPVTFSGLHIHRAAAGVNGPVVIASGVGGGNASLAAPSASGSFLRRTDIPPTDSAGLAALEGILTDPSQYYVNLHTTANPGGAIRGQMSAHTYAFLKTLLPLFEVPPVPLIATEGRALITARVARDAAGEITSGSVEFNVDFAVAAGPTTFTGLHIHNAPEGVNGGVVINSGLSAASPVVSDTGVGNITRTATIDADATAALNALRGLVEVPENYYVNLHTTVHPGGLVRSQLERRTLAFRVAMRPENEVPPVAGLNASATASIAARIASNQAGAAVLGTVDFDVAYQFPGAVTHTGLHIHSAPAGANGPVVIDSGLSGAGAAADEDGTGVIFRRAVQGTPETLAVLDALAASPERFYVNLHSTVHPGGAVRGQLASFTHYFAQAGGGAGASTALHLRNPSSTSSAAGLVYFLGPDGRPHDAATGRAVVPFVVPPGGTATLATRSLGPATAGYARVVTADAIVPETSVVLAGLESAPGEASASGAFAYRAAVSRNSASGQDAGIAAVNISGETVRLVISIADAANRRVIGGRTSAILGPGEQFSRLLSGLFPTVDGFSGTVRITALAPFPTQALAVSILQLTASEASIVAPVLVTKAEMADGE